MKVSNNLVSFRAKMKRYLIKEFGVENACPFWGNQNAKIVHISQAPSHSVVKKQKPFSDKSGERLKKKWYQVSDDIFYNPSCFYFTAIGMYFPGKDKSGGDKKPNPQLAIKWLNEELSFLNPILYLVVGKMAAEFFFPGKRFNDLVFSNQKINGKLAFVLPHPSPANAKWLKDNPCFESNRMVAIREKIKELLANQEYAHTPLDFVE